MGKRVMGEILGMGPERDVVADNDHNLQHSDAFTSYPGDEGYLYLQSAVAICILLGSDDIFRSQLLPVGSPLICCRRSCPGACICLYCLNCDCRIVADGIPEI